MKKGLEERFLDFLESENGFESIDKLQMTQEQRKASKADFFADKRQFIIEVKSLETDTKSKVVTILEEYRSRPDFPVFFGKWEIKNVLKHLPDGKEIHRRVFDSITTSIKNLFRSANKQIRKSKEVYNLPESIGILVILNETINILSPEVLAQKAVDLFAKTHPDGSQQFPNIDLVVILSETHFSQITPDLKGFSYLVQPNPYRDYQLSQSFINSLIKNWSEYNKVHHLTADLEGKDLSHLRLKSVEESKEENKTFIPRQEAWARYYKSNPYFRSYDNKMMLWMFEMIMSELTPGFLKGATQKQKDKIKFWMEVYTHFMEEVAYKGIDMRFFTSFMKEHGREIENEMNKKVPIKKKKQRTKAKNPNLFFRTKNNFSN